MKDEELLALVREALISAKPKIEAQTQTMTMDTRLDEFNLDSLATTTTSGYIEDKLDIELDDAQLPKVETIGHFVALVRSALAEKG